MGVCVLRVSLKNLNLGIRWTNLLKIEFGINLKNRISSFVKCIILGQEIRSSNVNDINQQIIQTVGQ